MTHDGHPCFDDARRHTHARIHLPVAATCNVQCGYCDRRSDCPNESRPGVSSALLTPAQAAAWLDAVRPRVPQLSVVGIAGPGDPLASADLTFETLRLVRERHPDLLTCVATNGLALAPCAEELARIGVSHVTVTLNAVDPEIGARLYSWVRHERRAYRGREAAELLLAGQTSGIRALKSHGVAVKVNTVVVTGVNDEHVETIAATLAELGVDVHNCIPMYHVAGTAFEHVPPPDYATMARVRAAAARHVRQMSHCQRCRADAVGLLGAEPDPAIAALLQEATRPRLTDARPNVAIASMEGLFVNQHLGEARGLWIYGRRSGRIELIGQRSAPTPGSGPERWAEMARLLDDCSVVLASGAGETPRRVLARHGIDVQLIEGLAQDALEPLFRGGEVPKTLRVKPRACGEACSGTGNGCG